MLLDLFLDPLTIAAAVLLGGLILRRFRIQLLVLGALLALADLTPAVSKSLFLPLSATVPAWPNVDAAISSRSASAIAAIVVPTAGVFPVGDGTYLPSPETAWRLAAGLALQQRTGSPLVVSGGSTGANYPSEAEVVAYWLKAGGNTASGPIVLETTARDTAGTALAVRQLVPTLAGSSIIVVTSYLHGPRIAAAFRHESIRVHGILVAPDRGLEKWSWTDFVPSSYGAAFVLRVLYELGATGWYLMAGRLDFRDFRDERRDR